VLKLHNQQVSLTLPNRAYLVSQRFDMTAASPGQVGSSQGFYGNGGTGGSASFNFMEGGFSPATPGNAGVPGIIVIFENIGT
jgi:hypothetical protein